jgi:5-methylcytosine-specific restriction endonuclease McrA
VLHLSEHAAYGRIEAARVARRFPVVLDRLAAGELTLTSTGLLAPRLTPDNHLELIDAARFKSKREVEHLVVALRPQPPAPTIVRKLPSPSLPAATPTPDASAPLPACEPTSTDRWAVPSPAVIASRPSPPQVIRPLAPTRYKVQFTVSAETFNKLRRVQDLMRHRLPDGDVATIFDRGLTLVREDLHRTKLAATRRPHRARQTKIGSRTIPAAVRRQVWARDEGRCAFVGTEGRCMERGFLEFHHVRPFSEGGAASVDNIELRCRAQPIRGGTRFLEALVYHSGSP